jgi:hypothetical protein
MTERRRKIAFIGPESWPFAYFSLEDAPKEVPLRDKEK